MDYIYDMFYTPDSDAYKLREIRYPKLKGQEHQIASQVRNAFDKRQSPFDSVLHNNLKGLSMTRQPFYYHIPYKGKLFVFSYIVKGRGRLKQGYHTYYPPDSQFGEEQICGLETKHGDECYCWQKNYKSESFGADSSVYVESKDYSNEIVEKLNPILRNKIGKTFILMNTDDDSWMFRLTDVDENLDDDFIEYGWEKEVYAPHKNNHRYVGFDWKEQGFNCFHSHRPIRSDALYGFNIPLANAGYEMKRMDKIDPSEYKLVKIENLDAESFSAENYYGRNYRGFEINKEGDERQAFYYLTQGDNRIEIEFTKSVEGRRKRGDNYNYASYFYGNYPHTAEKMFETFDEALNWFDEQIDNGRMFKDFKAESFGAETPCAVMVWRDGALTECGWWNEKNEPCVYHPDGKEINAESFGAEECVSCDTPDGYWRGLPLCSSSGEELCISCCSCNMCRSKWNILEVGEQKAESFNSYKIAPDLSSYTKAELVSSIAGPQGTAAYDEVVYDPLAQSRLSAESIDSFSPARLVVLGASIGVALGLYNTRRD